MALKVGLRSKAISPSFRERLSRQNPERVQISGYGVRTKALRTENEFMFRILEGQDRYDDLAGTPYRVAAHVPSPELPLFPIQIGYFDYRITSSAFYGPSAISGTRHDRGPNNDKLAMWVHEGFRKKYRGIGRAMASVAFNHLALEGVEKILLHNVIAFDFFNRLSRSARVVECYHEDLGPVPFSEVDPLDKDVVINMEIDVTREDPKYMPRILITLRSEPLEQVLAIQFRST